MHQKGLGYGSGMKIGVAVSWEMLEVAFRAEWIHPGTKNMRSALAVFQGIEILFSFFFILTVCASELESIPGFFSLLQFLYCGKIYPGI